MKFSLIALLWSTCVYLASAPLFHHFLFPPACLHLVAHPVGYLVHPFKKSRTRPARSHFSLGTELHEGTRGTCSSRWIARGRHHQARTTDPLQHAFRKTIEMQGEKSSFEGIWTHDDDPPAHLDSLRKGQRRCLLVKPPFGSHGAARLKSEQRPLWFLRAQRHEMVQRSRGSAAGCLDAVVPG
jgi:hypothetical protein